MTEPLKDPRRFLLDDVQRIGHTWHGLAFGGQYQPQVFTPHGTFSLPFNAPADYDTHLLKVPGVSAVDMTQEELDAEALVGRVWQNYALLSGSQLQLFGKSLNGWVCIDPAGGRWLVKTNPSVVGARINKDAPLALTLSVVPFGQIGEAPATPFTLSVALNDIGQASTDETQFPGDPYVAMKVGSVSSNGRKVVIELHNQVNSGNAGISPQYYLPSGFLQLELSGPGPNFTAALTVLRTRAQVVGSNTKPTISGSWSTWAMTLVKDHEEPDPLHPGYAYVTFKPGSMVTMLEGLPAQIQYALFQCSATATARRDGRVVALVFGETDQLVEFTCSHSYTLSQDHGAPSLEASGSLVCLRTDAGDYINSGTGDMVITPKAQGSGYRAMNMSIYRDGAEVLSAELKITHQFTRTYTQSLDGLGDIYFDAGRVQCFDIGQGAEVVQQSWTMRVGSQSMSGSYPGHDYRYGITTNTQVWSYLNDLLGNPRNANFTLSWGEDAYVRNASWSVVRPSNNLVAVSWGENDSGTFQYRVAKIVGPDVELVPNDPPASLNYAVTASYHPVTKEIARPRPEITAPFCWI